MALLGNSITLLNTCAIAPLSPSPLRLIFLRQFAEWVGIALIMIDNYSIFISTSNQYTANHYSTVTPVQGFATILISGIAP
jgi:hypothetical protein